MRKRMRRWMRGCVFTLLLLIPCSTLLPAPVCAVFDAQRLSFGDTIRLRQDEDLPVFVVRAAIQLWERCDNYGAEFPELLIDQKSVSAVVIDYEPRNSEAPYCGLFAGRTITLFRGARTSNGMPVVCPDLAKNLAHEIGHVLGLGDLDELPGCDGRIMAPIRLGAAQRRRVRPDECRAVARRWKTTAEVEAASKPR